MEKTGRQGQLDDSGNFATQPLYSLGAFMIRLQHFKGIYSKTLQLLSIQFLLISGCSAASAQKNEKLSFQEVVKQTGFLRNPKSIHTVRTHSHILQQHKEYAAKMQRMPSVSQQTNGEESAFHGWWQQIRRGNTDAFGFGSGTDDTDSYIFIDTTTEPFVTIFSLAGTPEFPRERTTEDGEIEFNFYYMPTSNSLVHVFDLDGPFFDPTFYQSWWSLTLQDDQTTLVASPDSRPTFIGYDTNITLYKKVEGPQNPVRPFDDTDAPFPDITDPVELARQLYSSQRLNANEPQNINFADGDYKSFYERQEIFDRFVHEGFEVTTPIRRVRVTRPGAHIVPPVFLAPFTTEDRVTDIFTEVFSYATAGSTVEIGGFEGAWSCLNGCYVNGVAVNEEGAVPNPSPHHVDVCSKKHPCRAGTFCNVFNHFLLNFDSSDCKKFPRDKLGYAKFCGKPWVKVTHHITSDMEYPAFMAAIEAMFYKMFKVSFHNWFIYYSKPNSIFMIESWNKLKEALATDNFSFIWAFSRINQNLPSGFFNNAARTARFITTYNDPFGIEQEEGSLYDYNIVMANYLIKQKTLYWAIEGTPDLTPVAANGAPIQFDPVDVGYKPAIPGAGRASFVGALGDIVVVDGIPMPQNPDATYYEILGTTASQVPNTETNIANSFYVGIINPALSCGRKIGYLHWKNMSLDDPFGFVFTSTFAPDVAITPKYGREAITNLFANYTRFFNNENCDAVIIDIRTNNGGNSAYAHTLAELFGADRAANIRGYSNKDNGNSNLVDFSAYTFFENLFSGYNDNYEFFYVSQNEANYPGSVFKGSSQKPKKVVVLTDSASASSGDVLPHYFLGENLDGNLGSYTTGVIIGDIDGRLKGAASAFNPTPLSQDASRLYFSNNDPAPPFFYGLDYGNGIRKNGLTDVWFNQQSDLVAPRIAPTLVGKAGHAPLPNDWETNVWPAIGLIKAPKGLFSDKISKPKPSFHDRATWRDPWLEQAILEACNRY